MGCWRASRARAAPLSRAPLGLVGVLGMSEVHAFRCDRLGAAHRRPRMRGHGEVLLEREPPGGALTGLGRDDSRFPLPAGAGRPGDPVPVAVAGVIGDHLEERPL